MIKATKLLKNEQSLLMAELEDPKTTSDEETDIDYASFYSGDVDHECDTDAEFLDR